MRVIAGKWRGARLDAGNIPDFRPLTDRIKESLFGGLGERVETSRVLDLFAGSGSFGIEALSRGARHVVFVEKSPQVTKILLKNLQRLQVGLDQYELQTTEVARALSHQVKRERTFDIVFADPPFRLTTGQRLLDLLAKRRVFADRALLVIRHHKKEVLAPEQTHYDLVRSKTYGESVVDQFVEKR